MAIEAGDYGGDEDEIETTAGAETATATAIATTKIINRERERDKGREKLLRGLFVDGDVEPTRLLGDEKSCANSKHHFFYLGCICIRGLVQLSE